jgi:hypothetical protein
VTTTALGQKIEERHTQLRASYPPQSPRQDTLLHTVASEEVLEEHCQDIGLAIDERERLNAQLFWDTQQRREAEELAAKLPKQPALVQAQLEETPQGAALLISRLTTLLQLLKNGPLGPIQITFALDLLGVPLELRVAGQTILDPQPGQDAPAVIRAVLQQELTRLQAPAVVAARAQNDRLRRTLAEAGTPVQLSKDAQLMKRYQTMHARRRREAWAEFVQMDQALKHAARAEHERTQPGTPDTAPTQAPAASVKPAQPAATKLPWGYEYNRKYSQVAPQGPYRDREKERAEHQARGKQQKNNR